MRSLIIGLGEVGTAIREVFQSADDSLSFYDNWAGIDKEGPAFGDFEKHFDVLHICFGYSDKFIEQVKEYQKEYPSEFTIIHSTVPVGTCSQLNAIHSPIRGIHPNLKSGILTFPKFLGGPRVSQIADYFRRANMKVVLYDKSETTEALKLFDTEYYRTCVEFAQRVKAFCDKHNLNFSEVYTIPNITYNEGYTKLGMPEVVRPVLQPIMKEIGGHCLMPNSKLIKLSE